VVAAELPRSEDELASGARQAAGAPPADDRRPQTGDQVIRENPASRGTEASAEVLVGPPWRMVESNAGPQQWY
jgi:hypothetical protein